MANITEGGAMDDVKRWVCYCYVMWYPDVVGRPRFHAFPDCPFAAGQGANQDGATPFASTFGSRWDKCRRSRVVWLTLFYASIELNSEAEWCFRRICACAFLSNVLQNVKDELHHNRLFASLTPPTVENRSQDTVQGVQVLSWERQSIATGHKSHLPMSKQTIYQWHRKWLNRLYSRCHIFIHKILH